jgi:hypothetical protein
MNLNRVAGAFFLLILFAPIKVSSEGSFQLGFKENAELTYEYSHVDNLLLNELVSEDLSYADFMFIPMGTTVKWKAVQVRETSRGWNILIEIWSGSGFNELVDRFQARMFKNPVDFSQDLFNDTASNLYVLPINVSIYLDALNNTIPSSERSYASVNRTQIIYDWTSSGRFDTIIHSYNRFGMLESFKIQYNHTTAFQFQLVQYILGFDTTLLWIVIGGSIGGSFGIALVGYWYWRKKSKKHRQKRKNMKILKNLS